MCKRHSAKYHENKMTKCIPTSTDTENTIRKCMSLSEREKRLFCNVAFALAMGVEIPVTLESAETLQLDNAGLKGFYLLGMKDLLCYPYSKSLICPSGYVWLRKLQGHKESGELF